MAKILDGTGNGPVMVNIRVRRLGTRPPTPTETIAALKHLQVTGRMPFGWQFMWVDWKNPELYGTDWNDMRRGTARDLDRFNAMLASAIRDAIVQVRTVRKVTG